jgi:superfamily II DNA or RNA helicase
MCPIGEHDERVTGIPDEFPGIITPKENQKKVFDATIDFLKQGKSGITVAYTGWGKTVLGYYAAKHIGVKTLVITTKDDIYSEWIAGACGRPSIKHPEGLNFLGLPENEVGEIRGDKCEVIATKFVVGMIHSISKGKYPDWVWKDFGLVIFDECHRVPADQFMAVADLIPAKLRLGLSATPNRADGKELVILSHIGPIRAQTEVQLMIPKVLRYHTDWKCPRVYVRTKDGGKKIARIPHEPGKTVHIDKILAADQDRNNMIAEITSEIYQSSRKLIIFSTLLDHLDSIKRCLIKAGIPGKDIGFYVGATGKQAKLDREKVKVKPIILTTYGMASEGTDIPWLDTALFAIPRSNITQPAGRVRREYDGKKDSVLIDLIDGDSPVYGAYAANRKNWYEKIAAVIKDMN